MVDNMGARLFVEGEARFRLMADTVPQILWTTDASGGVEFFNKQWFDYTGARERAESASQIAADHVHPDDATATIAAFDVARATGTTFAVEHRIRSATGEYRWFLVRAEPHHDPERGQSPAGSAVPSISTIAARQKLP